MNTIQKKTGKEAIDAIDYSIQYEGYLWYSDDQKPRIFPDDNLDLQPACFSDLPFVIEGNLYSESKGISIQIRHIDGEYHVIQFDTKQAKEDFPEHKEVTYIGHDIGKRNFRMLEAWEEVKDDPLLEGFPTLRPAWAAFIGFVNK